MRLVREAWEIIFVTFMAWLLFLAFFLAMEQLVHMTEGLRPFLRGVIRGVGGLFMLLLWLYSYFLLRNAYTRVKGIPLPMLSSSCHKRVGRRRA